MPIVQKTMPWARSRSDPPPQPPASPDRDLLSLHLPTSTSTYLNDPSRQISARPSTASAALKLLKKKHPKLIRRTHSKPSVGREALSNCTNSSSNVTNKFLTTNTTVTNFQDGKNNRNYGRSRSTSSISNGSSSSRGSSGGGSSSTNSTTNSTNNTSNNTSNTNNKDNGARTMNDHSKEKTILRRLEGQDDEEFVELQRVGCPHCSRKFAPEAAKRHVEICANNKSKPKPPPKASECYTDRFGIRRGGRGSLATSARVSADKATHQRQPKKRASSSVGRRRSSLKNNNNIVNGSGGGSGGTLQHKTGKISLKKESNENKQQKQVAKNNTAAMNEERVMRLSNMWGEIMFLLRKPITNSDNMKSTWQSAMNGVKFLQELNETASELGVQQGTLSRWLLPYDNQTSLSDQAATAPPLGSSELDGLMSHPQRRRLVSEAVGLRSLIRVKIADNADLEQALAAVKSIDKFMYRLKQTATEMNVSAYKLFQKL
jgi:hypothetical protein